MAKQGKNIRRVHVTVPMDDEVTHAWLDAQYNMSYSVRYLIHEHVRSQGAVMDVMSAGIPETMPRRTRSTAIDEFKKTESSIPASKPAKPKAEKKEEKPAEVVEEETKTEVVSEPELEKEQKVEVPQATASIEPEPGNGIELDMDAIQAEYDDDADDGDADSNNDAIKAMMAQA